MLQISENEVMMKGTPLADESDSDPLPTGIDRLFTEPKSTGTFKACASR